MRYKSLPGIVRSADPSRALPPATDPADETSGARPRGRRFRDIVATIPILLLVPALLVPFIATKAAAPDPLTCVGYPQPRVFVEAQDWWTLPGDPVEGGSRHIHAGTCFPWKQHLSGIVPFDIQVQLHNNPGTLTRVEVQLFGKAGGVIAAAKSLSQRCTVMQCVYWYHLDVDTTKYPNDGRQEFRVHASVLSPDGSRGLVSTGWQAYLDNGHPVRDYRSSDLFTEGRGWYTAAGYTIARVTTAVPTGTVSGIWKCGLKIAPGSGGSAVNRALVTIDPKFHADPLDRGDVLYEGGGAFVGTLAIDTTKLSNGVHRLVLRADSPVAKGTSSGVQVITFTVKN